MKTFKLIILYLLFFALQNHATSLIIKIKSSNTLRTSSGESYAQIIDKFKLKPNKIQLHKNSGSLSINSIQNQDIYQLNIDATNNLVIEMLQNSPDVEYVEEDQMIELLSNDPLAKNQYHFNKIENVLNQIESNHEVIVAVIDSGVNFTHEDLIGSVHQNNDEINNGIDDDENGIIDDIYGANFSNNQQKK